MVYPWVSRRHQRNADLFLQTSNLVFDDGSMMQPMRRDKRRHLRTPTGRSHQSPERIHNATHDRFELQAQRGGRHYLWRFK
eukprot:scaffold2911_cov159-Skeletonema_dohrnii-CCMP3373.AAC.4